MCRVISTFITQGAFWGLMRPPLQLWVPGQSNRKGAAGVILTDGREGRSAVAAVLLALTWSTNTAATEQNKGKNITCNEVNKVKC